MFQNNPGFRFAQSGYACLASRAACGCSRGNACDRSARGRCRRRAAPIGCRWCSAADSFAGSCGDGFPTARGADDAFGISATQPTALTAFLMTQDEIGLFTVSASFGLAFSGLVSAYVLTLREFFPARDGSGKPRRCCCSAAPA
jgi:hypothetical protein